MTPPTAIAVVSAANDAIFSMRNTANRAGIAAAIVNKLTARFTGTAWCQAQHADEVGKSQLGTTKANDAASNTYGKADKAVSENVRFHWARPNGAEAALMVR